jgi:hypothetical protein
VPRTGLRSERALEVLEEIPNSAPELATWFANMEFNKFDSVCSSAIVLVLEDAKADGSFVGTKEIATMVNAMRDRYRRELSTMRGGVREKITGENNPNAKANEMQVRIIRRIPDGRHGGLTREEVGSIFNLSPMGVCRIRQGLTWKHLHRRRAA